MTDIAIKVSNLFKVYRLYQSPKYRLLEVINFNRKKYHEDFYALHDINFEVRRGETVGIVGINGSGKSTLLKIITGVLTPSKGEVIANGSISSLLELGTGFNPELSGFENIFFFGLINGKQRSEVESNLDEIINFADIGQFIYQPIKSYSSGMFVRLAFACAINIYPEILIIDEALSVGDAKFQAKCFAKLNEMKKSGTTILFVSHSTEQIIIHCERAILLNYGKIIEIGEPRKIINVYLDLLFDKNKNSNQEDTLIKNNYIPNEVKKLEDLNLSFELRPFYNSSEHRWGDKAANISDFIFYQGGVKFPTTIKNNQKVYLKFKIEFIRDIQSPIFGLAVKTKEGITIYNTNSVLQNTIPEVLAKSGEIWIIEVQIHLNLSGGDFFISVGIASKSESGEVTPHDRRYDSIHLEMEIVNSFTGLVDLKAKIEKL
jgi:lipopolysaccharide transport system ATP-binding protein